MNFIFIIGIILILYFHNNDAVYLIPSSTVLTQVGASYVLFMKDDKIKPEECYINDGTNKYSIELYRSDFPPTIVPNNSYTIVSKANEFNIITSIGNGICGFKMDSVTKNTTQKWNISFIDQEQNMYSQIATIIVRPTFPRHVVRYEKVGGYFSINCADSNQGDNYYDLNYCKLLDPHNRVIKFEKRSCIHSVQQSRMSDFGIWKCLQSYKSHMLETEVTYEFIPKEIDVVQTWTNISDNHVYIGCSVINATSQPDYCVMVRPDGKHITLRPGLATKRYTAFDTNFTHSVCVMQIAQPLEEYEKGLWKCEQTDNLFGTIGGFINVSAESATYKAGPKIPSQLFVHINKSLTITCEVPFSSTYCYLRGPDGFMYPASDRRKNSLGICEFQKEDIQLSDNGTWICGFARSTGEADAVYNFQIYVPKPIPIQPEVEEIETKTASTARLICTTRGLGDYPLKYCRFLSPTGIMYQIENHQSSDRFSYIGRGLEYGDCGIILQDVSESDQGIWSCITRLENNNILGQDNPTEEVYTNMHLSINDNLSFASTLGISLGAAAVIIFSAAFAFHRYKKRKNYQTNFDGNASETVGDSNDNDIAFNIVSNTTNRSYNTNNQIVRNQNENLRNPFDANDISSETSSENNSVIFNMLDDTTVVTVH